MGMRYVLLAMLLTGCSQPASMPTAPTAIVIDSSLLAWHGGDAVAPFMDAVGWWNAAGASIAIGDSGCIAYAVDDERWQSLIALGLPIEGDVAFASTNEIDFKASAWIVDESSRRDEMAHEIGHAIGLGHVEDPIAVMYRVIHSADGLDMSDVAQLRSTL